jgi:hypothetical protein
MTLDFPERDPSFLNHLHQWLGQVHVCCWFPVCFPPSILALALSIGCECVNA